MPLNASPKQQNPVASLFNGIASWYDFLNHFLSMGQDIYWRKRQARGLRVPPGGTVLDLAAGTMDVTLAILSRYPDTRVIAMDVSSSMLHRGQKKIPFEHKADVLTVLGDGRKIPLPTASVDCVTISFGIRNIVPRPEAHAEIMRVLKPGGKLCILEFGTGKEKIWGGLYNLYLDKILPLAGRLISKDAGAYRYLADTIKHFPSAKELATELHAAGFGRIMYQPLCSGIVYLHTAEKPSQGQPAATSRA